LTPFAPAAFHILLSLGAEACHGYALQREIARARAGRLSSAPVHSMALCRRGSIKA
jgi:hypothetical protein